MSWLDNLLKHCPFCGSVAQRTGGVVGNITINTCRCSNNDCIASFKSMDHDVWTTRADERLANSTTVAKYDVDFRQMTEK